jgi:hypothetical protein
MTNVAIAAALNNRSSHIPGILLEVLTDDGFSVYPKSTVFNK